MIKKIHIIMMLVVSALVLAACGSVSIGQIVGNGSVITEEREVDDFSRVQFNSVGRVEVSPGSETSLSIEGESNIVENIVTRVSDDALIIENRNNTPLNPTTDLIITITTPTLTRVAHGGAGDLIITEVKAESFSALIGGAGTLTLANVEAASLEVNMSGAGRIAVEGGEVATLDVFITGLGSVDTSGIAVPVVEVSLGGAGEATVWAVDTLDITITGAGSVRYYGDPQLTQDITGLGDIVSLGEPQ